MNIDDLIKELSETTSLIAISEILEDNDSNFMPLRDVFTVVEHLTKVDQDCILVCINWLITDDRFSTRQDIKKLWEVCARDA